MRAASAAATKSKHFVDTNGDVLSVSPEVIASMIAGALEKGDDETLHLVITEADRVGQVSVCPSSLSSIYIYIYRRHAHPYLCYTQQL